MKISVAKDFLKEALTIASKALSKNVILVERGHLLFRVTDKTMRVSGTNNDLKALCTLEVQESEKDVTFTADPKVLEKLISKIDLDVIKMDFDPSNLTLKVYTSLDEESFNTLQSFPPDKMLNVSNTEKPLNVSYIVNREILLKALEYAVNYLEKASEEKKNFDFVIINNGIVFAANGINKMGYFVVSDFKGIKNIKIRKQAVPMFISVLEKIPNSEVMLGESDNDIVLCSTSNLSTYFSCLKSTVEAPKIDTKYLKIEGPFVSIDRKDFVKKISRLITTKTSMLKAGIDVTLSGAGDTAYLDVALLSNLKAKERIPCKRVNDTSMDDVKHIMDYQLFTTEISSFVGDTLSLYINTPEPHFKILEVIKEEKFKYLTVGVGSYSKMKAKG